MNKAALLSVFIAWVAQSYSQTPQHFYHNPSNAGVNNLYFNEIVSYKFVFIYTLSELQSMTNPVAGSLTLDTIFLRSNTAATMQLTGFTITIGHSTLSVPVDTFLNNFNSGPAQVVLNEPAYNYTTLAGTWNVPGDKWSALPIDPFVYNYTDNICVMMEYSSNTYPTPFYANNGGVPITKYTNIPGGSVANGSTARPMFGFSMNGNPLPNSFFQTADTTVCEKSCIDFNDASTENPVSWQWYFEGGSPDTSSLASPAGICYSDTGLFDVQLITCNAAGCDTAVYVEYIEVLPAPPIPVVSQNGSALECNLPGYNYQWYDGNGPIAGAISQVFTPAANGAYYVVVTNESGCTSQSPFFQFTSIQSPVSGIEAVVYADENFITIQFSEKINSMVMIEMVDAAGHLIEHAEQWVETGFSIPVNHLKGFYILNLKGQDFSFAHKLIL